MNYRITCLTPTLVRHGEKLSPIDYMVWKDQVNVLNQQRIFRLLARGPRLEGYLGQLKRADRLDFASWGGFAQNYAGRRIPFEHASSSAVWERARVENLTIPTFCTGPQGFYLPASALKGAIRTAIVSARSTAQALKDAAARVSPDGRGVRQAANAVEDTTLGSGGANAMRLLSLADSRPVQSAAFNIYLLRVCSLDSKGQGRYEAAWKQAPRGSSKRPDDSTPIFAEMAVPGTTFAGEWHENAFLSQPEISRTLRAKDRLTIPGMFTAMNEHASQLLRVHIEYAESAGLSGLKANLERIDQRLAEIRGMDKHCLLPLGWGAGFLSKTAFLDTREPAYREVLSKQSFYARAIQSNLPFPKTRRIVFLENQPATLPGFVELEVV